MFLLFLLSPLVSSIPAPQFFKNEWTHDPNHDIEMTIQSSVPVLYMDKISDISKVNCYPGSIEISSNSLDEFFQYDQKNVLIVMGQYQSYCASNDLFVLASNWDFNSEKSTVSFKTRNPKGIVEASYQIQVKPSAKNFKRENQAPNQAPKTFEYPFNIDMNFARDIPLPDERFKLSCDPASAHGNAKISVTITGDLFSNDKDIKAVVTGQLSSVLNVHGILRNTTDNSGGIDIYHLPFGPIMIPNILNIGPTFSVK
jgi:hypothetical protein